MKRWAPGALALARFDIARLSRCGNAPPPRRQICVQDRSERELRLVRFQPTTELGTGQGWYFVRVNRVDRKMAMIEPDLSELRFEVLTVEAV